MIDCKVYVLRGWEGWEVWSGWLVKKIIYRKKLIHFPINYIMNLITKAYTTDNLPDNRK